jgi:hypothetical protein
VSGLFHALADFLPLYKVPSVLIACKAVCAKSSTRHCGEDPGNFTGNVV